MRLFVHIALLFVTGCCFAQYQGGIGGGGDTNCGALVQVLPVELLYFTATPSAGAVLLQWATASERNNAAFSVERSADAADFRSVQEIGGAGNSQQVLHYELVDRDPLQGTSYYRLKQTDMDGTSTWSDVVSVTISAHTLLLYPDPATDEVSLVGCAPGDEVQLLDAMGRLLRRPTTADGMMRLDLSDLPSGRYLIRVLGTGSVRSLPLMKR